MEGFESLTMEFGLNFVLYMNLLEENDIITS